MKPIPRKPIVVAIAIFLNSLIENINKIKEKERAQKSNRMKISPLLSGFVHLFTKRMESDANCRTGASMPMTPVVSSVATGALLDDLLGIFFSFNYSLTKICPEGSRTHLFYLHH